MNRKQFLILIVALVVLGGGGLALFWQDIAAYRESGARIGGKLLPEFKVAEVAQVRLQDAKTQVTLVRKDDRWVVDERAGYTADFQAIGDLIVKLAELKVTQFEQVGASLLPRVDLVEPGKGEGGGTLVEFKDKPGKALGTLILGKKVLKKDPLNPLPSAKDGVPAGRYVRIVGSKDQVVVVSDPLNAAFRSRVLGSITPLATRMLLKPSGAYLFLKVAVILPDFDSIDISSETHSPWSRIGSSWLFADSSTFFAVIFSAVTTPTPINRNAVNRAVSSTFTVFVIFVLKFKSFGPPLTHHLFQKTFIL